jgi:hypothetical protein
MAIYKRNAPVGIAAATSANGSAVLGANLSMEGVSVGSLVLECTAAITTASVLATFKLQGSMDGATWFDLYVMGGASGSVSTATPAGTGAEVVTTRALIVPAAAHAYPLVRGVATLSGATTAPADTTKVVYRFVAPGGLENVR